MTIPDEITVVTETAEPYLNPKQLVDYRSEREACLSWLLALGKKPEKGQGYAVGTVKPRAYRMDQFYRWVWEEEGGYTANLSHEHADAWMTHLAKADYSSTHKTNCQKSVKMLFKWRKHERGDGEWDPDITFSETTGSNPKDYLTREERTAIRNASLEYGSLPSYSNVTPAERDRWKQYLAQRLEKQKSAITPGDWEKANSWKVPSLVWTSLDAGLRPVEVQRATPEWVDTANSVLRIPEQDSAKSRDNWIVSIRDRTAEFLERWCSQRENYEKYEDTDALWLTREANPYSSTALRYVLHQLCDIAEIETDNRQMSWYAIRHSVGTYMTREEDLAAAQAQLRHKSPETTMKYDQTPAEDRQDALDRMG
ncbi:tyrosine-type recombinase/integrase [Halosimplex pelagicum]|uniref:Tyrosine-type recombinase/integrase n=1 Tax=Halosimplex pelagicum TaxID=869886 RepID=A0A7D5TBM5_9EURY|nr:site-specific integrase [Halosimplex pelagicum]QLH83850.1 tyrosine-type recombinase/integrase [Halosimplex pelagicum]